MEGFVLLALQTEDEAMSRGTQAVSPDAGKSRETAAPPYGPQEVRPPAACCPSWASDLRNREVITFVSFQQPNLWRFEQQRGKHVYSLSPPFLAPSLVPFLFLLLPPSLLLSCLLTPLPFLASPPFFLPPSFLSFLPSLPPSFLYLRK